MQRRIGLIWWAPLFLAPFVLSCGDDLDPDGDADGDTITNSQEEASKTDTDDDGFPDYIDLDSDGDAVPDIVEAGDADLTTEPVDTDGDGTPDYRDTDADGDTILDTDELSNMFLVVDSDDDGAPDFQDTDSDDDGIPDSVEAVDNNPETLPIDTNGDGDPDFRDVDSDGDCIPDAIEAGPNPATPTHSDSDGIPDYRDLDSDGDGLPDADEDVNCNGILEAGESSPTSEDTDGDGTPDLVEVVAGSDPNDATDNIPDTDFYFVLPFQGPGQEAPLTFATSLRQADIFFSIDTTGSFGEEIRAIQTALSGTIIPGITAIIPDAAFGVGRVEDFPLDLGPPFEFGLAGDLPFELLQAITTNETAVANGLAALEPVGGGLDTPEAGFEALYQWATGVGFPDFNYPPFAPAGIGGVGFRADSLPIIIHITDARSHTAAEYPFPTHSRDDAVAAMTQLGIRMIGVDSLENQGTADDPRAQLEGISIDTAAVIPMDVNNNCQTGVGGADRPATDIDGLGTFACPLVFDVLADGTGLGALIVDAVGQLAAFGVLDISTTRIGELMGLRGEVLPIGTTTADFIIAITPVGPPPAGATIDGDVFRSVQPGDPVTFNVQAFNDFVPATQENQLFAIDINILGDAVTLLDVRRVFVIVPKESIPLN